MKKRNLLGLFLLLGAFTAQVFAQDLTPVYERTDMELNGKLNSSESNAEAVPATEASKILNANALTVAIEYSISAETFASKSPMPFVAASSSAQAWSFISLQAHNRYGLCCNKKEGSPFGGDTTPNGDADYSAAGYNQKAVFVVSTESLTIYLNNNEVASASGDFSFKGKDQLYIGALKNGNENGFTDSFQGTIHSIRFFDQALTKDQVAGLFNNTGAIEGVNADSKAIYYADGVVYNQAGEIAIYNVTGKLVLRTSESTVDTRDLANGIYIVRSTKGAVKFVK